jgi:hypothetical protein
VRRNGGNVDDVEEKGGGPIALPSQRETKKELDTNEFNLN